MNGHNQTYDTTERIANMCIKINKYLFWIPVFPMLFLATSEGVAIKLLGMQHTLTALALMVGLLSYPVVYALSFVLAPRYSEIGRFNVSIAISLSPLFCILLALSGLLAMPH